MQRIYKNAWVCLYTFTVSWKYFVLTTMYALHSELFYGNNEASYLNQCKFSYIFNILTGNIFVHCLDVWNFFLQKQYFSNISFFSHLWHIRFQSLNIVHIYPVARNNKTLVNQIVWICIVMYVLLYKCYDTWSIFTDDFERWSRH